MRSNRLFSLALILFLLAGCAPGQPAQSAPRVPEQTFTPTATQPEATHTPTETAQPMLTPTPAGCQESGGRVERFTLDSAAVGRPLGVRVYTPPCYDAAQLPGYPVLYLLHGQSFSDDQWDRLGVPATADRLIAAGEAPPFLVVMPQEYYYLKDLGESTYGKALIEEVLPWVEANYAACRERACRAIGGLSRGASWAAWLGFESWTLFGAIGLHSLPSAASGSLRYAWLPQIPEDERPRLYLDIGTKDVYYPYALEFEKFLNEVRLPHQWHLNPGGHDEEYWSAHVEEYLRWYAQGW